MTFEELLAEAPKLHLGASGEAISWALSDEVLMYLGEMVNPSSRILETGCGVSTIVFAMRGARHTAIAPWEEELVNIRRYCERHSISLDRVELIAGRSEWVLPGLQPDPLDLVLIDGRHAFPSPFVDWFYTANRLVEGGVMVVDDTQLRTGAILSEFLDADPRWERLREFANTASYRKVAGRVLDGEWDEQPWMLELARPKG